MWTNWSGKQKRGRAGRLARLGGLLQSQRSAIDPFPADEDPERNAGPAEWRSVIRRRMVVAIAIIALWTVGLSARLLFLQVYMHDEYLATATRQQESIIRPTGRRGDIVDRHGSLLAFSVDADSLTADPTAVENPVRTAAAVCAALGDCTSRERQELARRLSSDRTYATIRRARFVSPEQVKRVAALKLPGVLLRSDVRRYYPGAELASHVVGFVDQDDNGQAGIEHKFDALVRGTPGLATAQVDAKRHRLETKVEVAPIPGATLELTIDSVLQHVAERELRLGVEENGAAAGTLIVMNPQTGEVLALASYPTFNPNSIARTNPDHLRNRATQDVYEPGSTFKIVTASAAIQEKVVTAHEIIDTSPGRISFPGRRAITEASGHNYGQISFEDVIIKSSNVGAIKVGLRTGAEQIGRYVRRFGFGQTAGSDFSGQSRGIWNDGALNDSGLASVSMGYQVSVTPLQMVTAVSAVANGGLLMHPYVVRAVIRDGRREVVRPKVVRRAIEPETAVVLREMMEGVVERGTAKTAQIAGYQSAGKTGTAHKVLPAGGYSQSDYNASFVGFVPSREPKFAILVVIDSPRRKGHYGGVVAAPIFRRVAEAALQRAGIPATVDPEEPVVVRAGMATLPPPDVSSVRLQAVNVEAGGHALMPDVGGLSARDAMRLLGRAGLSVRLAGAGFVTTQTPAAGERIPPSGWALIELGRTTARFRAGEPGR